MGLEKKTEAKEVDVAGIISEYLVEQRIVSGISLLKIFGNKYGDGKVREALRELTGTREVTLLYEAGTSSERDSLENTYYVDTASIKKL
ncbi:hypothetical protein HY448_02715 [Candidatus Pacearchaeota archaeon]|nr:hypothetical protein [Candidatus Pacearchaeota archaeon]